MNRFVPPIATLVIGVAGVSAMLLVNQPDQPARQSLTKPPTSHAVTLPDDWTTDDLSGPDVSYLDAQLLPYYRVDAPAWCMEDMPCWTGSNADNRSDRQVLNAIRCDIARGSYGYSTSPASASDANMAGLDAVCGEGK